MPQKLRMLRVGVSDESPFMVCAVESTLAAELTHHRISACPADTSHLLISLKEEPLDILITDFTFHLERHDLNGVSKLEEIHRQLPRLAIIVLTAQTNPAILKKVMKIPVNAIVSKRDDRRELIKAFRWVCSATHGTFYSEQVKPLTQAALAEPVSALLSPSEIEVIRLFAMGYSLMDIAKARKRSVSTVATQKYNAMRKLQLQSNADLIKYVFAQELV